MIVILEEEQQEILNDTKVAEKSIGINPPSPTFLNTISPDAVLFLIASAASGLSEAVISSIFSWVNSTNEGVPSTPNIF